MLWEHVAQALAKSGAGASKVKALVYADDALVQDPHLGVVEAAATDLGWRLNHLKTERVMLDGFGFLGLLITTHPPVDAFERSVGIDRTYRDGTRFRMLIELARDGVRPFRVRSGGWGALRIPFTDWVRGLHHPFHHCETISQLHPP